MKGATKASSSVYRKIKAQDYLKASGLSKCSKHGKEILKQADQRSGLGAIKRRAI